jgi:hypothetical protein
MELLTYFKTGSGLIFLRVDAVRQPASWKEKEDRPRVACSVGWSRNPSSTRKKALRVCFLISVRRALIIEHLVDTDRTLQILHRESDKFASASKNKMTLGHRRDRQSNVHGTSYQTGEADNVCGQYHRANGVAPDEVIRYTFPIGKVWGGRNGRKAGRCARRTVDR